MILANPGVPGVTVHLYQDLGVAGVPEGPSDRHSSKPRRPDQPATTSSRGSRSVPTWIVVESTTIAPVAGGTGWAEQTYAPIGSVHSWAYASRVSRLALWGQQPTVSDDFGAL